MSAEAIIDALATKVGAISGIKRAYGSAAYDSTVPTMPADIVDTPVALVLYDGFEVPIRGSAERLIHRFVVRVYVGATDVGAAYRTILPFPERFVVAFRTDADLGGTCQAAYVMGADRPEPEEVNGKPYLVLPVRVTADEFRVASYSV